MQTLTMLRKTFVEHVNVFWGVKTKREKGSVRSGTEQKWGVRNRELSNDPRDTQSVCIYVIVYITLLCWIYRELTQSHTHVLAHTGKMNEIHIRSLSRITREKEIDKTCLKYSTGWQWYHWIWGAHISRYFACVAHSKRSLKNEPSE